MTGVTIANARSAETYGAGCLSQCRCLGESNTNAASPAAVSAALYFASPARPRPTPMRSQNDHAKGLPVGFGKNRRAAANTATAKPKSNGPSGTIQLPAEAKKKGRDVQGKKRDQRRPRPEQLSGEAIVYPTGCEEQHNKRRTRAAFSPARRAAKCTIQRCNGG